MAVYPEVGTHPRKYCVTSQNISVNGGSGCIPAVGHRAHSCLDQILNDLFHASCPSFASFLNAYAREGHVDASPSRVREDRSFIWWGCWANRYEGVTAKRYGLRQSRIGHLLCASPCPVAVHFSWMVICQPRADGTEDLNVSGLISYSRKRRPAGVLLIRQLANLFSTQQYAAYCW